MSGVVIFWTAASAQGLDVVEDYSKVSGARLSRVTLRELGAQALAAAAFAAVVAVVEDDRSVTEALGANVDEVLRRSDLSRESIEGARARAEARARGRLRGMAMPAAGGARDDARSFGHLLDWIAIELVASLSGAVLESELLDDGIRELVTARGGSSPSERATDVLEMLETVKESQRRTREVLQAVRSLSGVDAAQGSACEALSALARVVRGRAVPVADITLQVEGACPTSVPIPDLVAALVALVGDALERMTASRREERGKLVFRAYSAEGASVVEIEDDAPEHGIGGAANASSLSSVRASMNEQGAEVIVEAARDRTTVRLLLPLVEASLPRAGDTPRSVALASRAN